MGKRRRRRVQSLQLLGLVVLAACATAPTPSSSDVISVYATSAAYPWLKGVYDCAPASVALKLSDPGSAAISIRLGESIPLTLPAYEIGKEDILVVTHPDTGVASLTSDQARRLFAGEITNWKEAGGADLPVEVWVFSPNEDIQALFGRVVMNDQPTTSLARLATSAQDMSDSVGSAAGSVGLLPRRWKAANTREALLVSSVPVLALVKSEPLGALRDILHCLQSSN
jgi:hypothetical protein